ncbi:MAG: hypothetical protein WC325_05730 [Candidatus Bathyarchaeia archaeon]|jgi:hypothetical protein
MPYHIIKKVKLLGKGSSVYLPLFAIDLEDDKTWGYFKLYRNPFPEIHGKVIKLLNIDGSCRDSVDMSFDFQTQTDCRYTDGINTKETRALYLPAKLVQAYGIDENLAIELVLEEVHYNSFGQKEKLQIYESKMVEGPMDITPIDNQIDINKLTTEITSNKNQSKMFLELIKKAQNLNLDINWIISAISLQLQEIAILKCASSNNIKLDKNNVEKVLGRRLKEQNIKYLSFGDQYDLLSYVLEQEKSVKMPKLTVDLRKMRVRVLHKGYNPVPEETDAIAKFSIGFLDKLKAIT